MHCVLQLHMDINSRSLKPFVAMKLTEKLDYGYLGNLRFTVIRLISIHVTLSCAPPICILSIPCQSFLAESF